jgi:hypothetical protein
MAPEDSHRGDLSDIAAEGTSIPNDAGKMNISPSKPLPGEGEETANANEGSLAGSASNPTDIPRSVRDIGAGGEVETGTGCSCLLCRLQFEETGANTKPSVINCQQLWRANASTTERTIH